MLVRVRACERACVRAFVLACVNEPQFFMLNFMCMRVGTCITVCAFVRESERVFVYVCVCVCVCACPCMCVHMCVYGNTCVYVYA